jgi:hypothetical protein
MVRFYKENGKEMVRIYKGKVRMKGKNVDA